MNSPPARPVLFTPGPVRIPPRVAQALAEPPCDYHRLDAFSEMFAATQADLLSLIGIRERSAWFATQITSTGTGANEACLHALGGLGKGLIVRNGFFGARLVDQATQAGLAHAVLDAPHDRPLDPDAVDAALAGDAGLRWIFFVSHETRAGLRNPMADVGKRAKARGLVVAVDVVSSAYAYPLDLEDAGVDLAVVSSAKAIMSAPGLGVVLTRLEVAPRLSRGNSYYLSLVSELETQRRDQQPRFAQPVALHAALRAACEHLREVGIERHMARIRRQLETVTQHLSGLGVQPMLDAAHRSGVATNFRLPAGLTYKAVSRRLLEEGYFVLYGIPGDATHFQVSTIGDLSDDHVAGLCRALSTIFG